MGERENFVVEQTHSDNSKGFFLPRIALILAVIIVLVLLIITAVIAAHVAKSKVDSEIKRDAGKHEGLSTTPNTINTAGTPVVPITNPRSTTPGSEPYWNIRLPHHVIPIHYDVDLVVNMKNFTFSGVTTIKVNVTKLESKYIILHVDKMINIELSKIESNGKVIPIKQQFEFKKNQFYVMEFDDLLKPAVYDLTFKHYSKLADDLKGFYISSYTRNGIEKFVAVTQFAPTDCRRAFPSFDEPAMKATFQITLKHDKKYISVSNMPLASSMTKGEDSTYAFATSIKMSTYLVVFIIGDFGKVESKSGDGEEMNFYAPKDQLQQLQVAIDAGTGILPFYNQFFNVSYSLPKLDMIALPDFALGAMENWGLITYRDSLLLFADGQSSESNRQRITAIVSHELAHQWFGNYVTMAWWDDVWLNEGFASYVEYLGVDHIRPEWKLHDQFVTDDQYSAFALDALVTSHPISVKVETPDQINELFDPISYKKDYLDKYALSNAKTSDLWTSLSKVAPGLEVSDIMDTWTLQMGFPVVTVTRTSAGFRLSQERFLASKDADTSKDKFGSKFGYLWHVPFPFDAFQGTNHDIRTVWLNKAKAVEVSGNFSHSIIKGNLGQNGFYRVNYESSDWSALAKELKDDFKIFDVADRAGLLGDVFALASAGYTKYEVALELFDYIGDEIDYVPWLMALRGINEASQLLSKSGKAYKNFKAYMIKKIEKRYSEIDFNKPETDQLTILLKSLIVDKACNLGVESCLSNASKMFTDWKENGKSIDPNFRSLAYYYGILNGGATEWDYAFSKSQETKVASERTKLYKGLSASQEPWIISRYLDYALNESFIKAQDAPTVFGYVSSSGPIGSSIAWSFFKENWSTIRNKFGSGIFLMRKFIVAVSASFSTQYELDQFNSFFNKAGDLGTVTRAVTQAREEIMAKIELKKKYGQAVTDWFDARSS